MTDEPSLFHHALPNVGADLRLARERAGVTLEQAAAFLRIRIDYLAAIEAEAFERLPAPAYCTGFLRSYAAYLGLDPARVIAAYKAELAGPVQPTRLNFPRPLEEPRRPRSLAVVAAVLLAAAVYGTWTHLQLRDQIALDYVPAPPARLVDLVGTTPVIEAAPPRLPPAVAADIGARGASFAAPAEAAVAELANQIPLPAADAGLISDAAGTEATDSAPVSAAPSVPDAMQAYLAPVTAGPLAAAMALPASREAVDMVAETAAEAVAADRAAEVPDLAAAVDEEAARPTNAVQVAMQLPVPAAAPPAPPPAPLAPAVSEPPPAPRNGGYVPQTFGIGNDNARVLLRARADSWVQVQGPNNELLLTRILRSGDVYRAPNRADLVMMTGNAGALEVIVDGRAVGILGGDGQVRRNVSLDAERLVALLAGGRN